MTFCVEMAYYRANWPRIRFLCGESGAMLRLQLVKGQEDRAAEEQDENHGTMVLRELTQPWRYSDRVVCADSYYSSMESAITLLECGL